MEKRWVRAGKGDKEATELLAQQLNIDISLAELLVQRGIDTFDKSRDFFRPQLTHLHDPFLMKDMKLAIDRIDQALDSGEKILVYGDYDVDGTTAVALVFGFFNRIRPDTAYYIPDRHKEGYGISTTGINYAKENGFGLIIALDCGIKSADKVAYARSIGIDFIICDHHLPGQELPDAVAVLDPKRPDCPYPFKELPGCGIGYKLVQAYSRRHTLPTNRYECYLDLVMVSIAADIVPLEGENRVLAHYGLARLNTTPSPGLKALIEVSGRKGPLTLTDVVFVLAPRINAAGRMHHGNEAVKLLTSTEEQAAREQSYTIDLHNMDRRSWDQEMTAQALALLDDCEILQNRKTTVVYHESWNKGIIGIVASRLTEKYYRPTVVLTASNGLLTGSARSVTGFDLYEALCGCEDLLEQFGGHQFAAGLTMRPEHLELFSEKFERIVATSITDELLQPELRIDSDLEFNRITPKFQRILAQMEPFGPKNPAPVFMSSEVFLAGPTQVVGAKHLKLLLKQQNSVIFEGIGFGLGEYERLLQPNVPFTVCYTIEENVWKEQRRLQLNVKAIKTGRPE
ncbi:single-stranded-DNA-specific exonuclease RecJ [Pedobacter sp. JY14-1]|uniref:single-stranded-DNA-specific exonuclease RecJ n=1 Tax=Pedobacter sp. JY14-1 TaxID=3034151 RepID=UPI0023E19443|nr:single-stranded-DNA-specific exonuclease RecJ [Pedobacter sp. JY14-1]